MFLVKTAKWDQAESSLCSYTQRESVHQAGGGVGTRAASMENRRRRGERRRAEQAERL